MSGGGLANHNPNKVKGGKWTVVRFFLCSVGYLLHSHPSRNWTFKEKHNSCISSRSFKEVQSPLNLLKW